MEQNIVIAIDHSAEAEQAVKCELCAVCMQAESLVNDDGLACSE